MSFSKTHNPLFSTGSTEEGRSRHDYKKMLTGT